MTTTIRISGGAFLVDIQQLLKSDGLFLLAHQSQQGRLIERFSKSSELQRSTKSPS